MKHLLFASVFTLVGWIVQLSAQTFPADPGFSKSNIGSGWNQPVGAAFSKDGKQLFIWEKGGKVFLCKWNSSTQGYDKQNTPVLDISPEVGNWRDHGMLGFALDPDFAGNGRIYVLYAVDRHYLVNFGTPNYNASTNDYFKATIGRLTRYQTITNNGNIVADLSTRKILIGETKTAGIPILYESHGVGSLVFAADKTLLVSAGDGASYNVADAGSLGETYYAQALSDGIIRSAENVGAFRAQMINSMNGKILRIDPATGDGISSNPFYSSLSPRSPQSRVWALGFRNPFRFLIKPNTGSLLPSTGDIGEIYEGEVGWSNWEELNIIKKGATNCGWPIFEGLKYANEYVAKNTANMDEPNPLFGTGGCNQQYFTFNNLIKQATADNSTAVYNPCNPAELIMSGNNDRFFHRRPVLDWKHSDDSARVGIFSGNNAITAQIGTAASNVTGIPFRGNCSIAGCWYTGSMFPSVYKNTYFHADYGAGWLNNMNIQFTDVVTRVDSFAKGFTAIVGVVEDPLDGSLAYVDVGSNTVGRIKYGGNQPPVTKMTSDKIYGPSTLSVNFTGAGSSDPEAGPLTYNWNFGDGSANSTAANPPTHSFNATGPKKFVVKLTVKDNQNAASTDSIIISVNNTPPVVNITSPIKNSLYRLGADTSYSCAATVTDAEQSPGQLKYVWQSFLRHNTHEHPEPLDTNRNTSTVISRIGCNGDTYYWLVKLTVTDNAGLSTSDSSKIFPNCIINSPLPLILRSFSVSTQNGGHLVKWITESETDLDSFVVERSTDAHQFIPINAQAARGGSSKMQYSFLDNTFPPGDSYYRLKIIDKTTGYYFSMIIRVMTRTDQNNQLVVIPNPVETNFTLGGFFTSNGPVQIKIFNANGKIIQLLNESVNNGFNNMLINIPPQLQAGIYFVEVKEKDTVRKTKFIKAQ
jgi:glucose/arabinose dehydrogenase